MEGSILTDVGFDVVYTRLIYIQVTGNEAMLRHGYEVAAAKRGAS